MGVGVTVPTHYKDQKPLKSQKPPFYTQNNTHSPVTQHVILAYMKTRRLQITIPEETYKLIANQPNKSMFINRAIQEMFISQAHDPIADRLANSLLANELFISELKNRITGGQSADWGA